MKILSIETSCDETAISIIEAKGGKKTPVFRVLANNVASQAALHAQYGGVFPMMAKREHSKNIIPLFIKTLREAKLLANNTTKLKAQTTKLETILEREPELLKHFLDEVLKIKKPKIDLIAVTYGPGLEPALWVGINFARALSSFWDIPTVAVNHMEGHILSILLQGEKKTSTTEIRGQKIQFPAIALLVSGGHTELVLVKAWGNYKLLGATRDDATGEAFDKVARILGLPYPGGPEISKLASQSRSSLVPQTIHLPRPMLQSKDYDFSFSGLKTAVLYLVRDLKEKGEINEKVKGLIAQEFEDATIDVLIAKTLRAVRNTKARTLTIGGGVAANNELRRRLTAEAKTLSLPLYFPTRELSTDNSLMIAIAGYFNASKKKKEQTIRAQGNLSF